MNMDRVQTRSLWAAVAFVSLASALAVMQCSSRFDSVRLNLNNGVQTQDAQGISADVESAGTIEESGTSVRATPIGSGLQFPRIRVVSDQGDPIATAFCLLNPPAHRMVSRVEFTERSSDANGVIVLVSDPGVNIERVGIYASGYLPRFLVVDEIEGDPAEVVLARGRTKTVKVEDAQGNPVSGVDLLVSQRPMLGEDLGEKSQYVPGVSGTWTMRHARTDSLGLALFDGFPDVGAVVTLRSRIVAPVNVQPNHEVQEPSSDPILITVAYMGVATAVWEGNHDAVLGVDVRAQPAECIRGPEIQRCSRQSIKLVRDEIQRAGKVDLLDVALFPSPVGSENTNRTTEAVVLLADDSIIRPKIRYRTMQEARVPDRIHLPVLSKSFKTSGIHLRMVDGQDRDIDESVLLQRTSMKEVPVVVEVPPRQLTPLPMVPGKYVVHLPREMESAVVPFPRTLELKPNETVELLIRLNPRIRQVRLVADFAGGPRLLSNMSLKNQETGETIAAANSRSQFLNFGRWLVTPTWRERAFPEIEFLVAEGVGPQVVSVMVNHGPLDNK